MIHPVALQPAPNQFFNAHQFQELSNLCTAQTRCIANIIATSTGKACDDVYEDMLSTTRLNAEQSQSYGLVNTVVTNLLPPDTELTVIYEDGTVRTHAPTASRINKIPNLSALFGGSGLKAADSPAMPSGPN